MHASGFDPSQLIRDYGDPAQEAVTCRRQACLFDFSFVRRASVRGPAALALIGRLTSRGLESLSPGQIRYALHRNDRGRLLSDLTIWRLGAEHYEVMTGRPADIALLESWRRPQARVADLSTESAIFALQGPDCLQALRGLTDVPALARLAYFGHRVARIAGIDCRVGRLGYTGEPGIEIILDRRQARTLWQTLAERTPPAGFAAADILRIEAGFALFANDFLLPVSAAEAGLAAFAEASGDPRPEITRVCFQAQAAQATFPWRPARNTVRPAAAGDMAITSACRSPLADGILGLGYVRTEDLSGDRAFTDKSGQFQGIRLATLPFYDPHKRRPRDAWPGLASG